MTLVWRREAFSQLGLYGQSYWLDAIPAGSTYLRYRFRWGFHMDTINEADMSLLASNLVSFGLVTTIGDGTETPPNAMLAPNDADPPTERWVYWETRAPRLHQVSAESGVMVWHDSGSTEYTDSKGQVKAVSIPDGDTLNLWASWSSVDDLDAVPAFCNVQFWCGISILRNFI